MNGLEVFTQGDTAVRTKMIDGEPCILLGDIVNAIGLKSTPAQVAQRLPDGVQKTDTIEDRLGRTQRATWVTEAGLYRVALRANTERAEPFIEWVTGEVLPTIRRTGSYSVAESSAPALPQSYADALRELASTVEAKELAMQRAEVAEARVVEDAPKVEAHDAFMDSHGCYSMADAARLVTNCELGRTKFMDWLRSEGILQKVTNLPYREHDHRFKVTAGTHDEGSRGAVAHRTTRVRPEGIDWLRERYARQAAAPTALIALVGGA